MSDERAEWMVEVERRNRRARTIRLVSWAFTLACATVYIASMAKGCADMDDCHKRGGVYVREGVLAHGCAEKLR